MVSKSKSEKIKKEAKQILDRFAGALEKIRFKEKALKPQLGGFRKEGEGEKENMEFRQKMFENAPNKKGDCIIAEKKNW